MKIGEKIKKLRTAKLMTQSDLVGGEITRNMLSRIENGAANPSLDTVCYIASRLNVPVGYLLGDERDEAIYTKYNDVVGIKKAFMNENYGICKDMCVNSDSAEDDEIQLLLCECNLALGIEEFNNGHLRESCRLFDEAIDGCSKTIYRTERVVAVAATYFRYISRISPSVSSDIIDENEVNTYPAMTDDFCRYALALERFDNGIYELSDLREDSPYELHLMAKAAMNKGDHAAAHVYLHKALGNEINIPQPVLYFIFSDLEICSKEIEDFRGAYEYSMNKLELIQRLLAT